jgi:hypothetical protein
MPKITTAENRKLESAEDAAEIGYEISRTSRDNGATKSRAGQNQITTSDVCRATVRGLLMLGAYRMSKGTRFLPSAPESTSLPLHDQAPRTPHDPITLAARAGPGQSVRNPKGHGGEGTARREFGAYPGPGWNTSRIAQALTG